MPLTQARGLLALDLRELGDGVGPVAVGEDDAQLLADDLVLQQRKKSSCCWALHGLIQAVSRNACLPGERGPKLLAGSKAPHLPSAPSTRPHTTQCVSQALHLLAVLDCCLFLVCSLARAYFVIKSFSLAPISYHPSESKFHSSQSGK